MAPIFNNEGQPDDQRPAAQTGHNGRDEKVKRRGLDFAAELFTARFFRGMVFLVSAPCANIEGLYSRAIMH